MEEVVFAGNVAASAYVLTEEDRLGECFSPERWAVKGQGEVKLVRNAKAKLCARMTIVGNDVGNHGSVLCHHVVHPDSAFAICSSGKGRMFWTQNVPCNDTSRAVGEAELEETCLKLVFESDKLAESFVERYRECQREMLLKNKDSEREWHRDDVVYQFQVDGNASGAKATIVSPRNPAHVESPVLVKEEPRGATGSDIQRDQAEEDSEAEAVYATDEEDDDSSCSEISLESFGSEDYKHVPRGPALKHDGTDWRCEPCRTMNPDEVDVCMACDVPRSGDAETKAAPAPTFDFGQASASPTQQAAPAFSFNTKVGDTKSPFSFGAPSAPSTGGGFSFGSSASVETKSSTPFSFGTTKPAEHTAAANVKEAEKGGTNKDKPKVSSGYPPMETMKKVEQVDPSKPAARPKPASSGYPPMETMKKVEQVDPSKPAARPKPASSGYPPMETMKKVEQVDPSKPAARPKPASSGYPPMETMKKVEQFDPNAKAKQGASNSKPGSLFGSSSGGGLFGNSSSSSPPPPGGLFGSQNSTTPNTSALKGSSLFGGSKPSTEGGSLFGSTSFGSSAQSAPSSGFGGSGLFGKPANPFGAPKTPEKATLRDPGNDDSDSSESGSNTDTGTPMKPTFGSSTPPKPLFASSFSGAQPTASGSGFGSSSMNTGFNATTSDSAPKSGFGFGEPSNFGSAFGQTSTLGSGFGQTSALGGGNAGPGQGFGSSQANPSSAPASSSGGGFAAFASQPASFGGSSSKEAAWGK